MTARDGGDLVGFVNVAWDGVVTRSCSTRCAATAGGGIGVELVKAAEREARAAARVAARRLRDHLRAFYFDACGFVPTNAGLIEL